MRTLLSIAACPFLALACAADWPMSGGSPERAAFSPHPLSLPLRLAWTRQLTPPRPAWTDEPSMQFDASYEPVAAGNLLLVASMNDDTLRAMDLRTGEDRWQFHAEGPIRFAPAAWSDIVCVGSDDGCLYGLDLSDGRLRWRFRVGPSKRRIIGNERLISTWPVRGGPVLADGVVYCAAGVWPFMGVFIHALDAKTGIPRWTNDGLSFTHRPLPHAGAVGLSGLSPQGYLAVAGNRLIVPGSRSNPAVLDRNTGAFLFFAEGAGPFAACSDGIGFAGARAFDLASGRALSLRIPRLSDRPVLAPDAWYMDSASTAPVSSRIAQLLSAPAVRNFPRRVRLRAGPHVVAADAGAVEVFGPPPPEGPHRPLWRTNLDGRAASAIAASGHLVVTTREGGLNVYGPADAGRASPATTTVPPDGTAGAPTASRGDSVGNRSETPAPLSGALPLTHRWTALAADIVQVAAADEGYAVVCGLVDGGLVEALAATSRLHIVGVDADPETCGRLRRRFVSTGLLGSRVCVVNDALTEAELPPYFANVIATEDFRRARAALSDAFWLRATQYLRPYGGAVCMVLPQDQRAFLSDWAAERESDTLVFEQRGELSVLRRAGAPRGSAGWWGQNADAGNTRCSRDQTVMAPLGVLWFGNALSNSLVLPRHGKGPVEQVAGGRLFIEGPSSLSAVDVYTGRLLWTRAFPAIGRDYDTTKHQAGATRIGANFFAVPHAVCVADGPVCHVLDPRTGQTVEQLSLPGASPWQFLTVYRDLLVAGVDPIRNTPSRLGIGLAAASAGLAVLERTGGRLRWERKADAAFPHNGVAVGSDTVFCLDRTMPEWRPVIPSLPADGNGPPASAPDSRRLLALDLSSGAVRWDKRDVPGLSLTYSEEHDVVLCHESRRSLDGALVEDMVAFRGCDGETLWRRAGRPLAWDFQWGPLLNGARLLTQDRREFDLLTGHMRAERDFFGLVRLWTFGRAHGCGPIAGSSHLLTFRSGCAGLHDWRLDGGTGNLSGFRPGCTPNLIVADGVLSAPDYTRTCVCPYDNRSSVALVHAPDVEYWTWGTDVFARQLGLNFGAPGDRMAEDGTLWFDYPPVGGPSPDLPVRVRPGRPRVLLHHASRVTGGASPPWVAASAVVGIEEIVFRWPSLPPVPNRCDVILHFAEIDNAAVGERVFSVLAQGRRVLREFDIHREAGGLNRSVVRAFSDIRIRRNRLVVGLTPVRGEPLLCGMEIRPRYP